MNVSLRRWGVVALVLLLVAVSGGWLGWRELGRSEARVPQAMSVVAAASAPEPLANSWLRAAAAHATAPGASAGLAGSQAVVATAKDTAIEVCGIRRISKREVEGWSPAEHDEMAAKLYGLAPRRDAALNQLSARLAAGSDHERVAARLVMNDAEGAAHIAARSGDAAAYRLALLGCRRAGATEAAPGCRGMTAQAWAKLDAQDARPWAELMAEAWQRNDEVAATQALEEMLRRRPRGTNNPLLEVMFNARGAVADVEAQGLLTMEMFDRDSAGPDNKLSVLLPYCSAERVKDQQRRTRCERLARWQFEHGQDLMDAIVAKVIADLVGIPEEQRPFTSDQLQLAQQRFRKQIGPLMGYDCATLRRVSEWTGKRVQLGELKMALQGASDL